MDNKLLGNAWNLIDEIADEETKENFELDDMLYDISIRLFDYRINKGWTQKQLAEVLGIKQAMVSKLESGGYNPTVGQLWKISKKLGWTFRVVLEEKNETQTDIWDTVYNENDSSAQNIVERLVSNA